MGTLAASFGTGEIFQFIGMCLPSPPLWDWHILCLRVNKPNSLFLLQLQEEVAFFSLPCLLLCVTLDQLVSFSCVTVSSKSSSPAPPQSRQTQHPQPVAMSLLPLGVSPRQVPLSFLLTFLVDAASPCMSAFVMMLCHCHHPMHPCLLFFWC